MLYRIIIYIFISANFLLSAPLSYSEILKKPKSTAKDYYIYRLLSETNSTTLKQTEILYEQTHRLSPTLQNIFYKKLKNSKKFAKEIKCKGLSAKHLLESKDEECIMFRISPAIVANLNATEKLELANLLENNPYTKSWVEAMANENVSFSLKKLGPKQFLTVFNAVNQKYKSSYLDKPITVQFIEKMEPLDSFSAMLRHVVYEKPYLKNIPTSLLYTPKDNSSLTHQSAFLLGIHALKNKRAELADKFFTIAEEKAYLKSDKDKSLFWKYLTTNNETILEEISKSFDINVYSLYAKEHFKTPIDTAYLIKIEKSNKLDFNTLDPFAWINIRKDILDADDEKLIELSIKYADEKAIHAYMFILERLSKYKRSYYATPYSYLLKDTTPHRQAIIYAIAHQESRFVPPSISTSYALGMMQFMPFLARDIAKREKLEKFDIDDMFKPEVAYKFVNIHLDYLDEYLHHPLFTAYAYNGGIGFTKRLLESKTVFNEGYYEPFMSLETVANNEAREYGKKVLANYVIYSKFLGNDVNIKSLFEALTKPELTDKFRQ